MRALVKSTLSLAVCAAMTAGFSCQSARAADPSPGAVPLGFSVENMDKSADPRKDFYRYASGKWLDRTSIPPSDADTGGFKQLGNNLNGQLLKIIQDAASAAPGSTSGVRQQVGDFFRSGMDLARLDALGLKPFEKDFARLDKPDNPVTLAEASAFIELRYGSAPLLIGAVGADPKQSTLNVLFLAPGAQPLNQSEYATEAGKRVRDLYQAFITGMLQAAGDSAQSANEQARIILEIETEIAAGKLTPLQQMDPNATYNKLTLAQAQMMIPTIDLGVFIKALGMAPPETVLVPDPSGLKAVNKVLAQRPVSDIRAFLRWNMLGGMASRLGQPYRGLAQKFALQREGVEVAISREREITQSIGSLLSHPVSQLYVQAYFPESTKRDIENMVGHIRREFELRLKANRWLDRPTREAALEKLKFVDIQVGYPKEWIDFSSVTIKPDDYFGNVQRLNAFALQRDFQLVGKPVRVDRFAVPDKTTPIAVNAAYQPARNAIDITAAISQAPFYVPGADPAVNYCTMGAVIGHELTHAFDSLGRQFGPKGNLRDWWTPKSTAEFKKRTDVLVKQFSAFEVLPGLMHNGALTVGENTADLGGLTLAYAALHRELGNKPQPKIDGMTTDQRCFVAWSQVWMSKARPERMRLLVAIDPHSISALRATGPLVHMAPFYKAFGIKKGDPMWRDPKDRVLIW